MPANYDVCDGHSIRALVHVSNMGPGPMLLGPEVFDECV